MSAKDMHGFYMVEKRVALFSPELLSKLAKLGVQVSGGVGKIHTHIWIPEGNEIEVFELLAREGFYEVEPYDKSAKTSPDKTKE